MSISIPGILVCLFLLVLGSRMRAPLIVPLLASIPFGSTAIATIAALAGSSPLIYVVFAAIFLVATLLRRHLLSDIRRLFIEEWTTSVVVILLIYAVVTSLLLPRMFAGETTAFVVSLGKVVEVMLAPNNGNVTQVAYFALGCLTFLTSSLALRARKNLRAFKLGFFSFAVLNATLGLVDLVGKMSGTGDILEPLRTASYQMLTNSEEAGLWRIAGGYPEASAFAVASLAGLGFAFAYWRVNKSTPVLILALILLVLVLLSTSSTAYGACLLIAIPVMGGLMMRSLVGRMRRQDFIVMGIIGVCVIGAVAVAAFKGDIVNQVVGLVQSTLLDKAQTSSGVERAYWNSQSMASFFDTGGLGIGFGSSRASSWVVAVISQTGVIGTLLIGSLVAAFVLPLRTRPGDDIEVVALHHGVRACVLAGVVAASISGGSADPGLIFFVGLAVCNACRRYVLAERTAQTGRVAETMALPPRPAAGVILRPVRPMS